MLEGPDWKAGPSVWPPSGQPLTASPRTITHNQLSYLRDVIKTKRIRDRERLFVLEGTKPILELLQSSPHQITCLVVAPKFLDRQPVDVRQHLLSRGAVSCPEHRLAQLSDLETSSGLLALVRQPSWEQAAVLAQPHVFGLYGDVLQDPTNVGTIIRTAAGLNVSALWLAPDSVDIFNPKVVRATAGTVLKLPIFTHMAADDLPALNCTIFAADSGAGGGTVPIQSIQALPARAIIAIGSESRGLSAATVAAAQMRFTIPLKPGVDSLNVAAAAAIALFHFSGLPVEDAEHVRRRRSVTPIA